jgi:hypothetical protein
VADRRSVFTDERVIERSRAFVCAADEVWRLQRGSEADCIFFQHTVNGGERITDRGTRQGLWVIAPSGLLLARSNTRDLDRVLACIDEGLAGWNELPHDARVLAADAELVPEHRWEASEPAGGLVLERIGRELVTGAPAAEPARAWNRDFAWFARDELVAALGGELEVGRTVELPLIARRLARFHLVDNVRGQSLPYADPEIEEALLVARVTARDGDRVSLVLEGRTAAAVDGPWLLGDSLWTPPENHPHGIECELLGEATWNAGSGSFDAFELVAVARHWGRTINNGRRRDSSPGSIAFHLRPAPVEQRIAPAFVDVYDAAWITRPATAPWRDSPEECGLEAH